MKIAFRYNDVLTHDNIDNYQFGHFYDLTKTMPVGMVQDANIQYFDGIQGDCGEVVFK